MILHQKFLPGPTFPFIRRKLPGELLRNDSGRLTAGQFVSINTVFNRTTGTFGVLDFASQ
jgi:hypothetical protein